MSKLYCPNCETELKFTEAEIFYCPKCEWNIHASAALKELPPIKAKMPYVSIDIETTGLDPEQDQVLEFGAVYDDWTKPIKDLPRFRRILKRTRVTGSPFALALNANLLKQIATPPSDCSEFCSEDELLYKFQGWLQGIDALHIQTAGKNFASFDLQFLKKLPQYGNLINFRHRTLDPAILFWNPLEDEKLPDTKTCMERAGIERKVAHTAIDDALVVVELVRFGVRKLVNV